MRNTKTLTEALLSITNANHQATAQTAMLNSLQETERKVRLGYNPYMLNAQQENFLNAKGIQTSPFSTELHAHPVHKTIENYILSEFVPHYLRGPYTAAYMKPSKFRKLPTGGKLINVINDEKDAFRYPHHDFCPTLDVTTPTLLLHDACHYYSPQQVAQLFIDNPNLREIVATTIIPPETLYGAESFYPHFYEIQYHDDQILYIPEGHHAGAYEQPLSAHWWLQTSAIKIPATGSRLAQTLSIKRVESIYAHHLFTITRTPVRVPSKLASFDLPRLTILPNIFPEFPVAKRIVPYEFLDKLIDYARAVKTNSELNLEAKTRFLKVAEKYDVPQSTIFLMVKYVFTLTDIRRKIVLNETLSEDSALWRAFEHQFGHIFHRQSRDRLNRFLSVLDVKEFKISLRLQVINLGTHELGHSDCPNAKYEYDDDLGFVQARCTCKIPFVYPALRRDKPLPATPAPSPTVIQSEATEEVAKEEEEEIEEEEEEDEDSDDEAFEDAAVDLGPLDQADSCGLQVFIDAGFEPVDVTAAYQHAKTSVQQSTLEESLVLYPNFLCIYTQHFPWLSGQEVRDVGSALGVSVNLFRNGYVDIVSPEGLNVFLHADQHWSLSPPE